MSRHDTSQPLRQGFTTGSAAAAAAKAALFYLLEGREEQVADIPLPGGGRLDVPVESVAREGAGVRAMVVKDAGDDPDATNKARISCVVRIMREEKMPPAAKGLRPLETLVGDAGDAGHERACGTCAAVPAMPAGGAGEAGPGREGGQRGVVPAGRVRVEILGGSGVGRVTLPGLPVAVGQPAINPVPRAQIEQAAREVLDQAGFTGEVRLTIEVENGETIARHTLNPRLGIVGGISILGTQGIVKPFSHEAWKATIESGLQVARAAGIDTAAFSTGRRSERMLMAHHPELPELCFVQAADFYGFSMRRAQELGFRRIVWGCFFGKLAKMAQGLEYTHAHAQPTNFAALAGLAAQAGAPQEAWRAVAGANTARHALEIVPDGDIRQRFADLTAARALETARSFFRTGPSPEVEIVCFGFEVGILAEISAGTGAEAGKPG